MKKPTVFATLNLMHKAMLVGQLIFTGIIFFLNYREIFLPTFAEHEKILQTIAILFTVMAVFLGAKLFKKKLALINENPGADATLKLTQYRSASIMQWGLLEAACLVCAICLLLTGNYAFLALAAVLILYFAMLAPVKNRIAMQLNLQTDQLDEL
jgi:hypothetical protein